ncbi:MAG: hypothetical protein CALGDGBN_02706 [Pseudomonadales bacterium]|nr:hypothetical protein [Pseudomonadales bacterium]
MTRARAINAVMYQLGWFACVLGGNAWALLALALFVPLHQRYCVQRPAEWGFVLLAGALGLAMDLAWARAGVIGFHGTLGFGAAPWLAVLWLMFATTLQHALAALQTRLALAALLGAVAGPVSYLAGIALGAASTPLAAWEFAALLAPAWLLLTPLLAWLARRASAPALQGATT